MKTIILNETKESKYIFADDVSVTFTDENIVTPLFIIGDMNNGNAMMIEGVVPPDDWAGNKYLFDNGEWRPNPNWVEPQAPQ
jgi:hypothetical protein